MLLTKIFEEVVDPTFHSVIRGLYTKGFGTTPPVEILANIQRIYRKPSYQELDAALLCLNNPMNQLQLVEVIIRLIEEVHLFLLANSDKERTLTDPNLISCTLIKIKKYRGMYAKGIEKRQKRPPQDQRKWAELLAYMV